MDEYFGSMRVLQKAHTHFNELVVTICWHYLL